MSQALVSIKVYSSKGDEFLKEILNRVSESFTVEKTSSIYRTQKEVDDPSHLHDLRSKSSFEGLCFVVKISTETSPKDLLNQLSKIEASFRSQVLHRNLSMNLLTYDDLSLMNPEVTLPHPDWHNRPEELVPAAEIWGDYNHPVLNAKVSELSKRFQNEHWGEFYSQGL